MRLFTGYLGWAPDQFEDLLVEGAAWHADQSLAYRRLMTDRPEDLPRLLARGIQGSGAPTYLDPNWPRCWIIWCTRANASDSA